MKHKKERTEGRAGEPSTTDNEWPEEKCKQKLETHDDSTHTIRTQYSVQQH